MKSVIEVLEENRRELDRIPSAYQINVSDVWEIAKANGAPMNEQTINAIMAAYEFGIIKGKRYAKSLKSRKH